MGPCEFVVRRGGTDAAPTAALREEERRSAAEEKRLRLLASQQKDVPPAELPPLEEWVPPVIHDYGPTELSIIDAEPHKCMDRCMGNYDCAGLWNERRKYRNDLGAVIYFDHGWKINADGSIDPKQSHYSHDEVLVRDSDIGFMNGLYRSVDFLNGRKKFRNSKGAVIYFDQTWKMNRRDDGGCICIFESVDLLPPNGVWKSTWKSYSSAIVTTQESWKPPVDTAWSSALDGKKCMVKGAYSPRTAQMEAWTRKDTKKVKAFASVEPLSKQRWASARKTDPKPRMRYAIDAFGRSIVVMEP